MPARDLDRRIAEIEAQARRLSGAQVEADDDTAAIIAEWREIRRADPPAPSPLAPAIAALTDREAVDAWRRIARGHQ